MSVCADGAIAMAQEPATRAEADRRKREEKDTHTEPYSQNAFEKGMHFAEEKAIFILDREGFYPKLGSLSIGSSFAYGVGFRDRDLFNNQGTIDLWGAGSLRKYWGLEGRFTFPRLLDRRLHLESWVSKRDLPMENFYGLGPDTGPDERSDYGIRNTAIGGRAGLRPIPPILAGVDVEFIQPLLKPGTNDEVPGLEEVYEPSEVPGINSQSDFTRFSAAIEVDYREPVYARKGGWYRLAYSRFDDRTTGVYTFNRFDLDLRQFIGFLNGRRVLAARAALSTADTKAGHTMPFFFMPTLGGNETLRGFRELRFRAPHALLLQAEYRWEIWSGLDGALFYDTGKVAEVRSDLDFSNLESDYGFGVRANTNAGIILRVDTAFGSRDGARIHIVFGGIF
jgi:outer membrane protein assembly factor BamA